jgi:hypothetical protein
MGRGMEKVLAIPLFELVVVQHVFGLSVLTPSHGRRI